ncbi:MAG: hypothetical protein M0T84_05190 [Betaproteobacteria bacterium]|nr:hypothetical protein [Betaproteobacteria bacterium]
MVEQPKIPKAPKRPKAPTKRQKAYLGKLVEQKGKRVVVDLDAESHACLKALIDTGFAETQSGVIRKALQESAIRLRKKRT